MCSKAFLVLEQALDVDIKNECGLMRESTNVVMFPPSTYEVLKTNSFGRMLMLILCLWGTRCFRWGHKESFLLYIIPIFNIFKGARWRAYPWWCHQDYSLEAGKNTGNLRFIWTHVNQHQFSAVIYITWAEHNKNQRREKKCQTRAFWSVRLTVRGSHLLF